VLLLTVKLFPLSGAVSISAPVVAFWMITMPVGVPPVEVTVPLTVTWEPTVVVIGPAVVNTVVDVFEPGTIA